MDEPFRRCVLAAGLDVKQVVRHTLRHTAITHLVQAGVDLPTVKRISGHKNLSMVERYSYQNGAHIQTAMDKPSERYKAKMTCFFSSIPKCVGSVLVAKNCLKSRTFSVAITVGRHRRLSVRPELIADIRMGQLNGCFRLNAVIQASSNTDWV